MSKEVNISDRLPRLSVTASPSASRNGGRVSMAKAWLEENYSIKVNLLDPSMVFLEAKEAAKEAANSLFPPSASSLRT